MSRSETIPTSRPASITGRCRTRRSVMRLSASDRVVLGAAVTSDRRITSETSMVVPPRVRAPSAFRWSRLAGGRRLDDDDRQRRAAADLVRGASEPQPPEATVMPGGEHDLVGVEAPVLPSNLIDSVAESDGALWRHLSDPHLLRG